MLRDMFKKTYTRIDTRYRAPEAERTEKQEEEPGIPAGMWRKCNKCGKPIYVEDVRENFYVCPKCGGYFRVHAWRRIQMVTDPGTFEEWGDLPAEKEEAAPEMFKLIQDLRAGKSVMEIIEDNPKLAFRIREIETLRQAILEEKYSAENRALEVTYLYGASGTGKTRGIFETHDRKSICRITDYGGRNGVRFDAYHCQDVLVLEEFQSQIPISAMLNYLDIYPIMLPARYNDRVACYTTVYLTSNIPLEAQYQEIQRYQLETWYAFLRRIHNVIEYLPDGSTVQRKKGGFPCDPK